MHVERATRVQFLRRIYRSASGPNQSDRVSYVDALSEVAISQKISGKHLISASAGGAASGYAAFFGWQPDLVLYLCEWCRQFLSSADADTAAALVPPSVKFVGSTFASGIR